MLSYLDINVHFYFLGKMSLLHSLYLIANPDLSYYTLENLSSAEEKAVKDFIWMYQDEIKDNSTGVLKISKIFDEYIKNEHPEHESDQIDGFFSLDNPDLHLQNFKSDEIKSMKTAGFNPGESQDRKSFYRTLDPMRRQDFFVVSHSWNTLNGKVIDLKGYFKYMKSGHSTNILPHRYIQDYKN
jgi:hypothetical protein